MLYFSQITDFFY